MNKITIALLLTMIELPFMVSAQQFFSESLEKCSDPKFEDACEKKFPVNDYIYLSSRDFSSDEGISVEYSVTLKKNILYVINMCEGSGNTTMTLSIWNSNDQEVATNAGRRKDKMLFYRPAISGKYLISCSFDKKTENCCLIMLGMIKKNIEKYIAGW